MCSGELTAQKTSETMSPLCAVENCPGDLRDPSPTVCSGEPPRRPQGPQPHCVQWRTAQETSGTLTPLCAVGSCPDLNIASGLEELWCHVKSRCAQHPREGGGSTWSQKGFPGCRCTCDHLPAPAWLPCLLRELLHLHAELMSYICSRAMSV